MSNRIIILDTETTGLAAKNGDKLVEIGAIECHGFTIGRSFQQYINPERDVPMEAEKIHGLSTKFLQKYPTFVEIIPKFLEFIGDSPLVIHNASFDMGFINYQLEECGYPKISDKRIIDSLIIARKKFPGAQASLDALCRRFGIDNSNREFHGALLDAELLCEVWIELNGGRQNNFDLTINNQPNEMVNDNISAKIINASPLQMRPSRQFPIDETEFLAHQNMVQTKIKNALWLAS